MTATEERQVAPGGDSGRGGQDLTPLFSARSIALIGASERMAYSRSIERNLRQMGFPMDHFFPVNPNRPEVFGRTAYPSVLAIPENIDLAIIVTGAATVLDVLEQCGQKGVSGALVLTDGFAESGSEGRALQERVAALARRYGIRLIGPNCFGFLAPRSGLGVWAGDLPANLTAGNVAAIFQSSGMLNLFLGIAAERRVGFQLAASAGNQAVLNSSDYLWHAVHDEQVEVIIAVVESLVAPELFVAALDAAAAQSKPVIVLRVGRSERGQRNALAHTGNLARSGAAWDALLRQHGAVLVEDMDELLEATVLFSACRPSPTTPGDGVGLVTISGGDCSLVCDLAEREKVNLPDLSPETQATLVRELEKPTLLGNPLDVENLLRQDEAAFYRCLDTFVSEPRFAYITARFNLPANITPSVRQAYEYLARSAPEHGKRLVFFSRASETLTPEWLDFFPALGVPLLKEYRKGLRTLRRFTDYEAFLRRRQPRTLETASPVDPAARQQLKQVLAASKGRVLGYAETDQLLSAYGIPQAGARLVQTPAAARETAGEVGWPVALKIASPDIPHKSDIGGLVLNLTSDDGIEEAWTRIMANVQQAAPDAEIEGIVVQRMVSGSVAETIVGLSIDPQLGPILMFGLGGVFVEIMKDVAFRVGRLSQPEARELVAEVQGAALLRGARGRPPADEQALVDVLVRVSHLGADMSDVLSELDINPLVILAHGQGALAVDALAVRADAPLSETPDTGRIS